MKKKGKLTPETLAGLIIFLVAFGLILFWVIFNFVIPGKTAVEVRECRDEVILATQIKKFTAHSLILPFNCPSESKTFRRETLEEIDGEISRWIVDCIWKYGEGEMDFKKAGWVTSSDVCIVCNYFNFDSGSPAQKVYKEKGGFQSIYEYMNENKIPYYVDGSGKTTYKAYLDGLEQSANVGGKMDFHLYPIKTDQENVIVFVRTMEANTGKVAEWLDENLKYVNEDVAYAREFWQEKIAGLVSEIDGEDRITAAQYKKLYGDIQAQVVVGAARDIRWTELCQEIYA